MFIFSVHTVVVVLEPSFYEYYIIINIIIAEYKL